MPSPSKNLSGLFANRYMIERELGHGGSAVVYLAHDERQDRQIALKVLDHELAHALGAERFLREIQITSRLQHPHILPIHDSGEHDGLLFYVLPYVSGESLRARLEREKQLPIEECVRLTCEVADALAHAHSKGVIHRDVKPENILLSDGHALIADFGIARALDVHTGERLTSSGLIVGTSSYMSPEQASGELHTDARTDIYSLGCVLYEMIAGIQPFVGPSAQAVIAQRFTHAPRPAKMFRPGIPEYLEHVLDRALAISPADRYQTMKDFAAELPASSTATKDRRRPGRALRDLVRTPGRKVAAAAVVLILAAFGALTARAALPRFSRAPAVDTTLFVVVPFPRAKGVSHLSDESGDGIYAALKKWDGLPLVSDMTVDAAIGKDPPPTNEDDAFHLARKLGAGRLIWGRTVGAGASQQLRLRLSDAATGASLSEVTSPLPISEEKYDTLVASLLAVRNRPGSAVGGDGRTKSFAAWRAYGRAHVALAAWNIPAALQELQRSVELDPAYAPARLWLGQIQAWQHPDSSRLWAEDARRGAAGAATLLPREQLLAKALATMADGNGPEACGYYDTILKTDATDFAAWFGLGLCREIDKAVVADTRSESGWSFRASRWAAAQAYIRALQLDPGAHVIFPFARLEALLPISTNQIRGGRTLRNGEWMIAYPSLSSDTIGFVPWPMTQFSTLAGDALLRRNEANMKATVLLLNFASDWTQRAPRNADAFEALAKVLEARGEVSAGRGGSLSALEATARARALSVGHAQSFRLIGMDVRLAVKTGQFARARVLTDSALRSPQTDKQAAAEELLAMAALTGNTSAATKWAVVLGVPRPQGQADIPPALAEPAAALFMYAVSGVCGDSVTALQSRLDRLLASFVAESEREQVRLASKTRALSALTPCTGGKSALELPASRVPLYEMQQAFAKRDYASVKRTLAKRDATRRLSRPGDNSLDYTYQEAWLQAAIGDSARALDRLDLPLNALSTISASALKEPAGAAAVGRSMVLRADLAAAAGDEKTAKHWAAAVVDLWGGADALLQPTVSRMRTLAARAGRH